MSEPTIARRIVRAKKAIAKAQVRFEVPSGSGPDPPPVVSAGVIYLIFKEGLLRLRRR